MAQLSGYNHITVHSDDEGDVVVMAGVQPNEKSGEPQEEPSLSEETPAREEPAAELDPDLDPSSSTSQKETPIKASSSSGNTSRKQPEDDYHETTLEDLSAVKMSSTQKVVLVIAIVGIIAALLWYLFAR